MPKSLPLLLLGIREEIEALVIESEIMVTQKKLFRIQISCSPNKEKETRELLKNPKENFARREKEQENFFLFFLFFSTNKNLRRERKKLDNGNSSAPLAPLFSHRLGKTDGKV